MPKGRNNNQKKHQKDQRQKESCSTRNRSRGRKNNQPKQQPKDQRQQEGCSTKSRNRGRTQTKQWQY